MTLNDFSVEDAALQLFEQLGYAMLTDPPIAPWDPAAECEALGEGELEG
jgi:hypothetical protein